MKKFSDIVDEIDASKKEMEIMPTGFPLVDDLLEGGFLKKELVVLGGATGRGKSLVAGNIFVNIARKGYKSAYFSLEIDQKMIVSRLLGAEANLSPTRIMIKTLEPMEEELKDKAEASLSVYEEFMYFYDNLYQYADIEKAIKEGGYDFVVVDFIQNVMMKIPDEYERLSMIALNLQKLAKETNCCILVLSQLSNMMGREKKNNIVEYKGSGSIGTVCDLGFFIEETVMENSLSFRLRKNRRGISGKAFSFGIRQPGGMLVSI
jgi:replicative DNA helicase